MGKAYVGIGSNLGDRRAHLALAQRELASLPNTQLLAISPIYETPPVGPHPQDPYLNAAALLETTLPPSTLLQELRRVEAMTGRPPESQRIKWGPRTLDLDILLYDYRVLSSDRLVVPHPLMHERWFVLKPLCDIAPHAVHPLLEMTVEALLRDLEEKRS